MDWHPSIRAQWGTMTHSSSPERAPTDTKNLADLYRASPARLEQYRGPPRGGGVPGSWYGRTRPPHLLVGDRQPGRRPHVTGVGALWVDGTFWFETGEHTRKGRNLASDPRCTLSVATHASISSSKAR